jgi:hypothetical protein
VSNGKYVYRVTLHDHSNLGGNMGSETTKVILTKVFETHRLAMAYAKQLQVRHCKHTSWARDKILDANGLTDLGSVGIEVKRERVYQ